ncbi:hypothetical protein BMS3Abin07_01698 [bacterium BMS3Abin07]|nr:hypothetical protein BMS3Abin07_01698 [bacterium BMS3Abin07]GBE33337.1 hypothetical protein BMS3Bbin05_02278 [bacterium BMS3Bbin05]HDO22240.1 hypothetical protein [Nitrospirota bacterium]HDZ77848.1 hypothetical protein [Gammaproteobacteria bacterium]
MPRQARLDAPGLMHDIMAEGIEQCRISRDNRDRGDFIRRVSGIASEGATGINRGVMSGGGRNRKVESTGGAGICMGKIF